jgi:hypothetical protein
MRHKWRPGLLVLASGIVGCGGDSDDPQGTNDGSCALPDGTYLFRYAQLSGDCPLVPDETVTIQGDLVLTPPNADGVTCETTAADCSDGNIGATTECTGTLGGVRFERYATATLDVLERRGTYSVRLVLPAEPSVCTGVYSFDVVLL